MSDLADTFASLQKSLASSITPPGRSDAELNPAMWTHKRLEEYIYRFEEKLDDDHEVGARLVSFGQALVFHIESLSFYGPDIITFYGTNDAGESVQLIQNISQLSVLLVAVKKQLEKPRRIGFASKKEDSDSEA